MWSTGSVDQAARRRVGIYRFVLQKLPAFGPADAELHRKHLSCGGVHSVAGNGKSQSMFLGYTECSWLTTRGTLMARETVNTDRSAVHPVKFKVLQ
jgi:hypothetical protein